MKNEIFLFIMILFGCDNEIVIEPCESEIFCVETEEAEIYCCPEFKTEEDCFFLEAE